MAKSLGNLFFTITADSTKFEATAKKQKQTVQEMEKQYKTSIVRIVDAEGKLQKTIIRHTEVSKRDADETTKGQKKMSLGFAAAAGAAAAFAFELIKSSQLAQFAMGVITDALEAGIVDTATGIMGGVTLAQNGYEDLATASDHYAKRQKGSSKEVHDAAQKMGTGIEDVIYNLNKVLPGPGVILNDLTDKMKTQLPEGSRSGMGVIIENFTKVKLDFGNMIYDMQVRWSGGVDTIKKRWGDFAEDMGSAWKGALDAGGAAWGAFTGGLKSIWDGMEWGVGKIWDGAKGGWDAFSTWATGAWSAISWAGNGIWESIKAGWTGFTEWLSSAWNSFWEGAGTAAKGAGDMLGGLIPKFQQGGYVSSTGLALVHEGETVIPAGQTVNNNQRNMTIPQIIVNVNSPQGLSFGGGVALGQDTRVAVVEAMRNVVGV